MALKSKRVSDPYWEPSPCPASLLVRNEATIEPVNAPAKGKVEAPPIAGTAIKPILDRELVPADRVAAVVSYSVYSVDRAS